VAPIAAAAALTAAPVGPPAPEIISAAPAEPPIADAHPAWSAQPHTITAANAALGATLATGCRAVGVRAARQSSQAWLRLMTRATKRLTFLSQLACFPHAAAWSEDRITGIAARSRCWPSRIAICEKEWRSATLPDHWCDADRLFSS
jgi:hypothetical protein